MLSGEPIWAQLVGVCVAGVVRTVLADLREIGDQAPAGRVAAEQEHFPGKLARGVIVARLANLDDVAEGIRAARIRAIGADSISRPAYMR
jgi:hypothetical protein